MNEDMDRFLCCERVKMLILSATNLKNAKSKKIFPWFIQNPQ